MDQSINTILVDDEAGCIDNLQHYVSVNCPRIKIVGKANDPSGAIELLNSLPVDVAFLDVHLFDQNIFDILPDIWQISIPIVFVTAYEHYALKAFKASALDYLLKPLETAEVLRCYEKIEHYFHADMTTSVSRDKHGGAGETRKIILRQGDNVYLIHPDNIVSLKAHGFYTDIFFEHEGAYKHIFISKPINLVYKDCDVASLIRVHRSYVINQNKVTSIKKHGVNFSLEMTSGATIPIAKRRATEFFKSYNV